MKPVSLVEVFIFVSLFLGTIQSFNIRGKRPDIQSEVYEGELSGMATVLRNQKLVVGCGDGKTYMFNWGEVRRPRKKL